MHLSKTISKNKRIIILLFILVGVFAIYEIWDSDYGYVYRNYFFHSKDELLLDFNRLEPINIVDTKKNFKVNWFCRKEQTQFGDFCCGDKLSKWNNIPAMTVVFWYRNGILTYAKIDVPPWYHDELIKYITATYGPPRAYSARKNFGNILSGTLSILSGYKDQAQIKEIRDIGIWQMDTGALLVVNIKKEFNPLLWSTVFWISPAIVKESVKQLIPEEKVEIKPSIDIDISYSRVPDDWAWWLRIKFVPRANAIRGIPADQLDPSWYRVSELRRGLIPQDLVSGKEGGLAWNPNFAVEGDFNGDGRPDHALIGVYEDKNGKFGNFLLILTRASDGKWEKAYLKSFEGNQGPIDLSWNGKTLKLLFCASCDADLWIEWNQDKAQYDSRSPSDEFH